MHFPPASTSRPQHRGFTVLELLVTAGIICLLLALIVPAVSSARRAAKRTQCQNNLKQIGLALINYHETFNAYPPGYVARDVSPQDSSLAESGPGYAWGVMLLDFVDQAPLASMTDFDLDATDPTNATIMATVLSSWVCPASSVDSGFDVGSGLGTYILAPASYVGMYGVGDMTVQPGRPIGAGAFFRNSYLTSWRVTDGLSNTLFVSERAPVHHFDTRNESGVDADSTWFAVVTTADRWGGDADHPSKKIGPASLVLGAVALDNRPESFLRPNHTDRIDAFSSHHEGGLNAFFGDGSVHFLHEDIDEQTLRRLAQYADGQVISEF